MFKKVVVYLAALALMLSATGCKSDTGKQAADGQPMTIDWLMYSSGPADKDAPVKQYFEKMFNVRFNLWYIERNKWDELLNVRFASGEIPDVFVSMSSSAFYKYVKQDIICELPEETVRQYAPDLAKVVDDYDPNSWKYSKLNGKNYAIPVYNYNNRYHIASLWRDDWLRNVGITKIPETLEEVEEAFYKFRNNDPDGNGKKDTYAVSDKGLYNSLFGAFGYLPRDMTSISSMWRVKDGKLVCAGVQPEMKQALQLFAKWYKDGLIDPEFLTGENTSGHWSNSQAFINGKIGYTANGMYYHVVPPFTDKDTGSSFYTDFKKIAGNNASYAVGRPPIGPDGKSGNFQGGTNSMGGIVFGKKLKNNPDKLHKILEIINKINTNKENYNISVYGFKDQHWTFDEETQSIISKPEYADNASLAKIGAGNILSMGGLYPKDWRVNQSGLITKKRYEWAEKNTNFAGISNDLLVELPSGSKYNAILDKLREQTYLQIITGEKGIDYFDEFVKQWRESGGAQLEKEANEWYTSFK